MQDSQFSFAFTLLVVLGTPMDSDKAGLIGEVVTVVALKCMLSELLTVAPYSSSYNKSWFLCKALC